jgi:hypothetical protein
MPQGVFKKSVDLKGNWKSCDIKRFIPYHLVHYIIPEFNRDKKQLRDIYNWTAIDFPYTSVAVPRVGTTTYEEDKSLARLARLWPGPVEFVPIYSGHEYEFIQLILEGIPSEVRRYRDQFVDSYTDKSVREWYFETLKPKRWVKSGIIIPDPKDIK